MITTGKTTFDYIKEGMAIYEKRIGRYLQFSRTEIPALQGTASMPVQEIRNREGELILKKIKPEDRVVILDEKGSRYTSAAWAAHLEHLMNTGTRSLVFIIGGAYGFSEAVYSRCRSKMSLSRMTFSHQMVRVIFLEQLYRAFTIMRGEPYHHE